ncbi:MAG: hypothetical protein QM767_03180 [Anaeromyxobacter sp.]
MKEIRLLVALSAAVLTIVASPAWAQSAAGKPAQAGAQRKAAQRKVLRVEELKVEGRVQKPQAMFLMPRANVNAGEERDRSESFVSEVKSAVEKDPF